MRKPPTQFEYSAGGVATKDGKFLLVQVENLQGEILWTFPKGHLEEGENPRDAALREVEEETGYRCEILEPLILVRYHFMKGDRRISKRVRWYWMKPVSGPGPNDAEEVRQVRWMAPDTAQGQLRYPGDFKLLELVLGKLESGREAAGRKRYE